MYLFFHENLMMLLCNNFKHNIVAVRGSNFKTNGKALCRNVWNLVWKVWKVLFVPWKSEICKFCRPYLESISIQYHPFNESSMCILNTGINLNRWKPKPWNYSCMHILYTSYNIITYETKEEKRGTKVAIHSVDE